MINVEFQPCDFKFIHQNFAERAKAAAIVYGGAQIGNILTNSISGVLIDYFQGWSAPFYFFGTLAVTWFIMFVSLLEF